MPTRNASALWEGGLRGGKGRFTGDSTSISGQYTFTTRFEDGVGTNPEELLAAAEASCFSMALSGGLEKAGATPKKIETKAACTVE
jgi:osmotically inducible protein OsmC